MTSSWISNDASRDEWMHLALEAGKSVGWDWDVQTGKDSWFGDLQTIFGLPSKDYRGHVQDFRNRVHPDDRAVVWTAVQAAMESRGPYVAEFRIVRPDGSVRWVAAQGKFHYATDGAAERMLGVAVDITERKMAEQALRESEERLRLAAQAGRMYAFEWDRSSDLVTRSAEFRDILGLKTIPAEMTCEQTLGLVHPADREKVHQATQSCSPENPGCRVRYRILKSDGSVIWLEKNGYGFFNENGELVRMVGMVADITERKRAEDALSSVNRRLIEAQESERARIARDLNDDIGQQIAVMSLTVEQLRLKDIDHEIRNRLNDLRKQILSVSSTINTLSHELYSSSLRYLHVTKAMQGLCLEMSRQHNVAISFAHVNVPETVPQEISVCLFRVLQEALRNGVKHSGADRVDVELCGVPGMLHLVVCDSGRGFDPESATAGAGAGLTNIQERLKLVDGELYIDSRPEAGTTLRARVPLA
ncbi:MAG TPA: PAS domain-containing protein [Terriglobia bacterium]|nr:PAS domain-containing protein [Terriglobia bacterium]